MSWCVYQVRVRFIEPINLSIIESIDSNQIVKGSIDSCINLIEVVQMSHGLLQILIYIKVNFTVDIPKLIFYNK